MGNRLGEGGAGEPRRFLKKGKLKKRTEFQTAKQDLS